MISSRSWNQRTVSRRNSRRRGTGRLSSPWENCEDSKCRHGWLHCCENWFRYRRWEQIPAPKHLCLWEKAPWPLQFRPNRLRWRGSPLSLWQYRWALMISSSPWSPFYPVKFEQYDSASSSSPDFTTSNSSVSLHNHHQNITNFLFSFHGINFRVSIIKIDFSNIDLSF